MLSGKEFILSTKKIFSFLSDDFNYSIMTEKNRRNLFYDVEYQNQDFVISISYENREDYLQIILFKLKEGKMPEYTDKKSTFHLSKLNKEILKYLSNEDLKENEDFFSRFNTLNEMEKRLKKSAKELRLCLKKLDLLFS